jgi:PPK2 family polyphosphate:nucleotide phosphotransferase
MSYATKLDKEQKINLDDFSPRDTENMDKDVGKVALAQLGEELCGLQEWLYAAQKHSVLIVLQGLDTAGKDGTISHVMSSINPQGCDVASFKIPTPLEEAHDFLWRVHQKAPARGMMTIFNRSHYEDVLVTRVHKLIDKGRYEERYTQINNFEKLLTDNDTIILKFFLHISRKEQEERLLAREKDQEKAWKLSPGDWEERQYWKEYQAAYAEALSKTATKYAPWYIVPADHKWYRNLAIAQAIVATLRPYKEDWEKALKDLGEERTAELKKLRQSGKIPKPDIKGPSQTHKTD